MDTVCAFLNLATQKNVNFFSRLKNSQTDKEIGIWSTRSYVEFWYVNDSAFGEMYAGTRTDVFSGAIPKFEIDINIKHKT